MKNILFVILILAIAFFSACDKTPIIDYDYHAHILSPSQDNKTVGDTVHIVIDFESHTGETIHHIKVRLYDTEFGTEIFNYPSDPHVGETSGSYDLHEHVVLAESAGVTGHTNWVLEAKVWGENDGDGEVIETVQFHVMPK